MQSITTEYAQEELECSMPQLYPGSCFEGPSSNSRRSDSETTSADDCFVSFLHEGDHQVSNSLDELTGGGEIYLQMVKELSSGKVEKDDHESKDKWYEDVVTDMKELSIIERELLTPDSGLVNFFTSPQDTNVIALSYFENMEPLHEEQNDQDGFIYPEATVTVSVSILLNITYCTRYHLSGEAMADL